MISAALHRFPTDPTLRLRCSFGVHLLYVLYKGATAVWYRSAWFGATAFYYLALSAAQFALLCRPAGNQLSAFRRQRTCGRLLLVLTLAAGAVNFYTIRDQQAIVYPWHLIYGAAAYTFYSLTITLVKLIRLRKDPLSAASRQLSLAASMMALFSLQAALLAAFGDGSSWETPLCIATGSAVFVLTAVLAVHMIFRSSQAIRRLNTPDKAKHPRV